MFCDFNFFYGKEFLKNANTEKTEVKGFIKILQKEKIEIVPTIGGWAVSSGKIKKKDLKKIINNFTKIFKKEVGKIDGIILALHGACAAEGCDSVDSYLIEQIRSIIGHKVPIMVSLDLHANITKSMIKNINAIVG